MQRYQGFLLIIMDNQTVIDTIVKYSKDCIIMRFIKFHLHQSLMLVKSLPIHFMLPSADTLKIVIEELDMRLNERESDIGKLLIPLFEGKDFGHKNSPKHSLTINEIRSGYIILDGEKYIIFLKEFKGTIDKFIYLPGVLYPLTAVLDEQIAALKPSDEKIIDNDLLNVIIKKKTAYEYLK